jgi:N utilization substance protein B
MIHAEKGVYHESRNLVGRRFEKSGMEVDDNHNYELEKLKMTEATSLFDQHYQSGMDQREVEASTADITVAVQDGIYHYQARFKDEKRAQLMSLISEAQSVSHLYFRALGLLVEMGRQVVAEQEEERNRRVSRGLAPDYKLKLATNPIMVALTQWSELQNALERNELSIEPEDGWARTLYREWLKPDADYQNFVNMTEADNDTILSLMRYVTKAILEKYTISNSWFEHLSLRWAENATIVRNMVVRTLKLISEGEAPEMVSLSLDWEDDERFISTLFRMTYENWDAYSTELKSVLKNWDTERLALSDEIILKMALAELLHIEAVPVKVTMNEYVELGRNYSTDASPTFINGVLDPLVTKLKEEKRIRKSGKGIMEG